ncbi:hypothetical protein ACFL6X_03590 [Candidatus Latescibacterota bacterium]
MRCLIAVCTASLVLSAQLGAAPIIEVDLDAGSFTGSIPFDQGYFIKGSVEGLASVNSVTVVATRSGVPWGWSSVPSARGTWTQGVTSGEAFLVRMEAIPPGEYSFAFEIDYLTTTRRDTVDSVAVATKLADYFGQDFGIGRDADGDNIFFYTGATLHPFPVNKEGTFQLAGDGPARAVGKRAHLFSGLSLNSLKAEGSRKHLLLDGYVLAGFGINDPFFAGAWGQRWAILRALRLIHIRYGWQFFKKEGAFQESTTPTSITVTRTTEGGQTTETRVEETSLRRRSEIARAETFFSVSLDLSLKDLLGPLAKLF